MEPSTAVIRVVIAEDHEVVRQGLHTLLELDHALDIVGVAGSGAEAVRLAHRLRPDVVLMHVLMPEMDGITATRIIRQGLPDTEVVALTSVVEDGSVMAATLAGAIGYLLKDAATQERGGRSGLRRAGKCGYRRPRRRGCCGRYARRSRRRRSRSGRPRCCESWPAAALTRTSRASWSSPRRRSRRTWAASSGSSGSASFLVGTRVSVRPRRAPAPQQRQRDPERTKGRILDAALEVFSAKGYAGARVAEIAARAGVNKQLIAYYFGGKDGLYRAIGRRWRAHEQQAYPAELPLAEELRRRIRDTAGGSHGSKLLAWQGLTDTGADDPDAAERTARLREEIAALRRRQATGELDPDLDPAALLLIILGAANALTAYPHIARGLFSTPDAHAPELVAHYAAQLAKVVGKLGPTRAAPPPCAADRPALEPDGSR